MLVMERMAAADHPAPIAKLSRRRDWGSEMLASQRRSPCFP